VHKVYAAGFMLNKKKPVLYYIDKENPNPSDLILKLVNELLRPKYSKTHFYCHNFGGYDAIFIIKTLELFNDNLPTEDFEKNRYILEYKLVNDKVI
jgi:hypothetical protein